MLYAWRAAVSPHVAAANEGGVVDDATLVRAIEITIFRAYDSLACMTLVQSGIPIALMLCFMNVHAHSIRQLG